MAGCGSSSGSSSGGGGGGKVSLTYGLWDPTEQVGYQTVIEEFQKRNPNISVTIQQTPGANYQQKIEANYVTETAPDVFWVNAPYLSDWIDKGIIVDVAPMIARDKIDLSIYYPALVKLHQKGDKTYGLPRNWDTIGLYYNKDYFKQRGIIIPKDLAWDPSSGGSYLEFLKELTVDTKGKNASSAAFDAADVKTYAVTVANSMQTDYLNYLAMNGSGILSDPYSSTVIFDQEAGVQTFEYLTNLINVEHVAVPGSELGQHAAGSTALSLFGKGRVAMYQSGDWTATSIQSSVDFAVGIMQLPRGPKGSISVYNGGIDGINSTSKHPDEAWELVKFLGSADAQQIMAKGGYLWPGIKSVDHFYKEHWADKGIDVQPFQDASDGDVYNYPISSGMGQATTAITEALGTAYTGAESAQSAVKKAAAGARSALEAAR